MWSAYEALERFYRPRLVLSGFAEQLLSQEGADVVKRLLSSPQNEVGGEDVDHALPRMDLNRSSPASSLSP